jgi:hypothetical protein
MTISINSTVQDAEIQNVRFEGQYLFVELNDGRLIGLPYQKIRWLNWLAAATPEQRAKWQIEPQGYAVWWDELGDGFELAHALSLHALPHGLTHTKTVLAPVHA